MRRTDVQWAQSFRNSEEMISMDFEKFTEKAQSAIVDCQNYAISEGHQQLDGEHLHLALVRQDQGLIGRLLDYMGVPKENVAGELEQELSKLPKVQGGQLYASQRFNRLLMDAEKKAQEFKDEFVSVEHLYLALLDEKNTPSAAIFKRYGITKDRFLRKREMLKISWTRLKIRKILSIP